MHIAALIGEPGKLPEIACRVAQLEPEGLPKRHVAFDVVGEHHDTSGQG